MKINVPELSLVLMVGASGSGKSTFARKHFKHTEIVSSDVCRGIVSDDENNQAASKDAFELVHYIISKRLKNGLLTVVDATNVQPEGRKALIDLAKQYHTLPVAIVIDLPERVCHERNKLRPDRDFGDHVIGHQRAQLKKSLRWMKKEGFKNITVLKSEEEVDAVEGISRTPLYNNKKHETGPFDVIGDVHGCFDELKMLLEKMSYKVEQVDDDGRNFGFNVVPPEGRRAIFVGDLVDRGPDSVGVLKLAMSMVNAGAAFCVPGNHDAKLLRKLNGKNVQLKHGLELTVQQLEKESPDFISKLTRFLDDLVSHYVFDDGNLVVAHAGLREEMHGRGSGRVREFCLYGETTGETDDFGLPVRYNWAAEYRGKALVVYGHTPVPEPQWLNRTIDIDTGCVFGGKLTALRYPERELVSVPALKMHYEPSRPLNINQFNTGDLSAQQQYDELLDIEDVTGKRFVHALGRNITIREENSIAALEVMSRFAIDPRWLIYLPPTMSPSATSEEPSMLEHPKEALDYFKSNGVSKVICEEKHMGSRAVVIVCRDEDAACERFGVGGGEVGVCYTRTGRSFFNDPAIEKEFLDRVRGALSKTNVWDKLETNWIALDCELMPWSAKAQALLQEQYAAVGAAASNALPDVVGALMEAKGRGVDMLDLPDTYIKKTEVVNQFREAYRKYCWPVNSIDDYKLAPFHILATEGKLHADKDHEWHMETIREICEGDPQLLMATPYQIVDLDNEEEVNAAIQWWTDLTSKGGEGMVVKPFQFITKNERGLLQPAVKCRGSEYLRIIYGPEYSLPGNISRLKKRGLNAKRSLALREFSLGMEGLERFVKKEPLRRVHECVFGVLALESEPVDPRL